MESENKSIFCSNCGTENPLGSGFCGNCGAKISAGETQIQEQEAVIEQKIMQEQAVVTEPTEEVLHEEISIVEPVEAVEEMQVPTQEPVPVQGPVSVQFEGQYPEQYVMPQEVRASFFSKYKGVLIIAVVCVIAVVGAVFAFNEIGKKELKEQLLKDWSRVESSDGTYYTLELDFSEDDIKYIFDCYFFTEEISSYDYEVVGRNKIKIDNRDQLYTIEFNDEKTMMTITPALTSIDSYENWFYHY